MNIQTRKDLTDYLQACLIKKVPEEMDISDEDLPSKSLKSYIIESNIDNLDKIILEKFEMKVLSTKDDSIKIISVLYKPTKQKFRFYVDLLDKRFIVFHSSDEAKLTDEFIESLISKDSNSLDYPWFFNDFMGNVMNLGSNESFSVRFRNAFYNMEKELAEIKRFSMRFWGNDGKTTLNQISKIDTLKKGISLSNVGVKIGNEDLFISDNVSYKGRFTNISGNSVREHLYLIQRIKTSYRNIINKIESSSIEYITNGNKISIVGEPIIIKFNKKISNVRYFANLLTSSKKPFRLWGISNFLSENYVTINGIDLHTGDKIDFEISNEWIRLYLPKGSCGNVIVRLLTNIQHYFDSNAKMIIGGEEINDY